MYLFFLENLALIIKKFLNIQIHILNSPFVQIIDPYGGHIEIFPAFSLFYHFNCQLIIYTKKSKFSNKRIKYIELIN